MLMCSTSVYITVPVLLLDRLYWKGKIEKNKLSVLCFFRCDRLSTEPAALFKESSEAAALLWCRAEESWFLCLWAVFLRSLWNLCSITRLLIEQWHMCHTVWIHTDKNFVLHVSWAHFSFPFQKMGFVRFCIIWGYYEAHGAMKTPQHLRDSTAQNQNLYFSL